MILTVVFAMGFFDKIKKALGSKKEDVESQNNDGNVLNDEKDDSIDFVQTTQRQVIELSPNRNILFVCTTNTTISPMAEAIYNSRVTGKKAFSAGLSTISGEKTSDVAINVCAVHGIDLSNHHTSSIDDMPIEEMDLILTSSRMNRDKLMMKHPDSNIFTIKEYAGYSDWDIDDPFGDDLSSYEECFREIYESILKILDNETYGVDKPDEFTVFESALEDNLAHNKTKNFKELDELLHSHNLEVTLDCDYVLEDGEESEYSNGIDLSYYQLVLDGNGHTIDARGKVRIFNITSSEAIIKNLTLKRGSDGAMTNRGSATLENIRFMDNKGNDCGAVYNHGNLTIKNTKFLRNHSIEEGDYSYAGGAIYNDEVLILENTKFKDNTCIVNGGAIFNKKYRELYNNPHGGLLVIRGCEFINNVVEDSDNSIYNYDGTMVILDTVFDENPQKDYLYNDGLLYFKEGEFDDDSTDLGEHYIVTPLKKNEKGFCYLKQLLYDNTHKTENYSRTTISFSSFNPLELKLDYDLKVDMLNDEELNFLEGIVIKNGGNIVIDGNGHTIDAQSFARIFKVCYGNTLTLKNINLKNGYAEYGGAIYVGGDSNVNLIDSVLCHNVALKGGAIYTNTHRTSASVDNTIFIHNNAETAGAIFNGNLMSINKGIFKENASQKVGAIYNEGHLLVKSSNFQDNVSHKEFCGDIYNKDKLLMSDSSFLDISKTIFNSANIYIFDKNDEPIHNKGNIYEVSQLNNLEDNFAHLDKIIRSGISKIKLEKDIKFDTFISEELKYPNGILIDRDNLTIDGNGHVIDAQFQTEIFNISGKNIKLQNMTIKNVVGNMMRNNGDIILENVTICENDTNESSLIYNSGSIVMIDSTISQNVGKIISNSGEINIFKSNITKNFSPDNIIDNGGYLTIESTDIESNNADKVIFNHYNLSIVSGKVTRNNSIYSSIYNERGSCLIAKTTFEDNASQNKYSSNVYNTDNLLLQSPKINYLSDKTIFNKGTLVFKESSNDLEITIYNEGLIEYAVPNDNSHGFSHLDDLIHNYNNQMEILLEEDITLEWYERDFYEGGIELDIDGLVIDGQNHKIDADNMSRFFIVTGKNITLKNIHFVNGHSFLNYLKSSNSNGGAIRIFPGSNLQIENCVFDDNKSDQFTGVIDSRGNLDIYKSCFSNNYAKSGVGVIKSDGDLNVHDTTFAENESDEDAGVICNSGQLTIHKCIFNDNVAKVIGKGGAILNYGDLTVYESEFNKNTSHNGGAIYNSKILTVKKSTFNENIAEMDGGALYNGATLIIEQSTLTKNDGKLQGGALYNVGKMQVLNNVFMYNKAKLHGGAIFSNGLPNSNVEDSNFIENSIYDTQTFYKGGGAIARKNDDFTVKNCTFEDNGHGDIFEITPDLYDDW